MAGRQRKVKQGSGQKSHVRAGKQSSQKKQLKPVNDLPDDQTQPETQDSGGGVGQDSVYDASGAATGGGVDTPTAVEKSTEAAVRRRKPINQGSSAYTGGGADNGSDL